jgi:hypothetical protein
MSDDYEMNFPVDQDLVIPLWQGPLDGQTIRLPSAIIEPPRQLNLASGYYSLWDEADEGQPPFYVYYWHLKH